MGGLQQVFDQMVAEGQNPFDANDAGPVVDLGFWWNQPQQQHVHNPAMGGIFNDIPIAQWAAGGQQQPTPVDTAMRPVVKSKSPPRKSAGG